MNPTDLPRPTLRANLRALPRAAWILPMVLGPSIGTWIYERKEPVLWITCAVFGVIAATLALQRPQPVPSP